MVLEPVLCRPIVVGFREEIFGGIFDDGFVEFDGILPTPQRPQAPVVADVLGEIIGVIFASVNGASVERRTGGGSSIRIEFFRHPLQHLTLLILLADHVDDGRLGAAVDDPRRSPGGRRLHKGRDLVASHGPDAG